MNEKAFGLVCDCDPTQPVTSVCHHCGKPLCDSCQILILDRAFAKPTVAAHCKPCKRKYHFFDIPHRPYLVRAEAQE